MASDGYVVPFFRDDPQLADKLPPPVIDFDAGSHRRGWMEKLSGPAALIVFYKSASL
jgi:hypothetical protein